MPHSKLSLVQAFGCGVLLFDRQGQVTFVNQSAQRLLGPSLHPRSHPLSLQPLISRLLQGETIASEEFCYALADGGHRVLTLNGSPLRDAGGEISGAVIDFNDITEKSRAHELVRQARDALQRSEAHLRRVIGCIDEIVFEFDSEGVYRHIWTVSDELLRHPRQALLGRRIDEVIEGAVGRALQNKVRQVLQTGTPQTFEYPLEVLKGRRWFLARLALIPSSAGAPPTVAFLARDITGRKQVENELRASEHRFHQALESIQLAALILDRSGRVEFCNPFLLRLAGWSAEEVLQHDWFTLTQPAAGRQQARESWVEAVCSGGLTGYHEESLITRDGRRRLMGWNTIVIRNGRGKASSCASIGEDITERCLAEAILRRSDQLKSEFISIAAHELRTPLTSILGYAELLLRGDPDRGFPPEQQREFLQEIYDKGEVLADIINELLDLSRIEAGQPIPLHLSPCTLQEILTRTVHNFQRLFPHHRFDLELAETCPADILIDRQKMEQVLENLLSNAAKYSPADTLIRVIGRRQGKDYLVEVVDQGIGMTAEQVERIFDKFYRADLAAPVSGLGLGMSIVRGIVEAHGGRIWVESWWGEGTRVSLRLPASKPDEAGAASSRSDP